MAHESLRRIVQQLRAATHGEDIPRDADLLEAYCQRRDEAAFECLVWRHAPMVLGVCRRWLSCEADAEDAVQATFLVLVQKASRIEPRASVGAWLHGVAYHVARRMQYAKRLRQAKESSPRSMTVTPDSELHELIDHEVNRLPEKYRVPLVLCELEGKPIAATADELGWPQGTLASRLARGKAILAKRLRRHGFALTLGGTASVGGELVARVRHAGLQTATPAVLTVAQGVMRSMFLKQARWPVASIVLGLSVWLLGIALAREGASDPPTPKDAPKEPVIAAKEVPDAKRILGRWRMVPNRSTIPKNVPVYTMFEFIQQEHSGLLIASTADLKQVDWYTWALDSTKKTIDLSARVDGHSLPNQGLFQLDEQQCSLVLNVPLRFQGDPGKHQRPKPDQARAPLTITLERERMAWSEPAGQVQYGLCTSPHNATIELSRTAAFDLYVRNTSNDGVDIDLPMLDGNPRGWSGTLTDAKGGVTAIPGPVAIPGLPAPSSRLKMRLTSHGVAHIGTVQVNFAAPTDLPKNIWPEGIVKLPAGDYQLRYTVTFDAKRQTGPLPLTLKPRP